MGTKAKQALLFGKSPNLGVSGETVQGLGWSAEPLTLEDVPDEIMDTEHDADDDYFMEECCIEEQGEEEDPEHFEPDVALSDADIDREDEEAAGKAEMLARSVRFGIANSCHAYAGSSSRSPVDAICVQSGSCGGPGNFSSDEFRGE